MKHQTCQNDNENYLIIFLTICFSLTFMGLSILLYMMMHTLTNYQQNIQKDIYQINSKCHHIFSKLNQLTETQKVQPSYPKIKMLEDKTEKITFQIQINIDNYQIQSKPETASNKIIEIEDATPPTQLSHLDEAMKQLEEAILDNEMKQTQIQNLLSQYQNNNQK